MSTLTDEVTGPERDRLEPAPAPDRAQLMKAVLEREPFSDPASIRERHVTWIEPELVAELGFTEWTSHGRLRHPRFLGLRDDKSAREVVRER